MHSAVSDRDSETVIVTGASSLIGHFLVSRLLKSEKELIAVSRSEQKELTHRWYRLTEANLHSLAPPINHAKCIVHLGPLKALEELLPSFSELGGKRVIAFSSTSRYSKLNSSNEYERQLAQDLIDAEGHILSLCESLGLNITLIRPTLIYGAGLDRNVSSITRFIRRFGFFPLVGEGSGLRQPVHADDLAAACIKILDDPSTFGNAYDLVGGETLTYREMVERIFTALNKKPRFIRVPLPLFRLAMRCVTVIPAFSHVTPDMADRMNQPLCFNSDQAKADFNYQHRGFTPDQQDLVNTLSYARL